MYIVENILPLVVVPTSFGSAPGGGTVVPFPQLREMLDRPSLRRSDARKKRRAVGSAAPRMNDTACLPASLLPTPRSRPMTDVSGARRPVSTIDRQQQRTIDQVSMRHGAWRIPALNSRPGPARPTYVDRVVYMNSRFPSKKKKRAMSQ